MTKKTRPEDAKAALEAAARAFAEQLTKASDDHDAQREADFKRAEEQLDAQQTQALLAHRAKRPAK